MVASSPAKQAIQVETQHSMFVFVTQRRMRQSHALYTGPSLTFPAMLPTRFSEAVPCAIMSM